MQRSIYLAKLIGPVFIVIAIGIFFNGAVYRELGEQFLRSFALIYLTGLIVLPAGIALVLAHNVWTADWRVILTIFGWLAMIGGIVRLVSPQFVAHIGTNVFSHPATPLLSASILFVLGAVLSYCGYADQDGPAPSARTRRTARKRGRRS